MQKILKSASLFLLAVMGLSCAEQPTLMEQAETLQRSILTLDTHCDTPMSLLNKKFDVTKRGTGCVDFPKMREGALDMESFAIFTPQRSRSQEFVDEMYNKAIRIYDTIKTIAMANPEEVGIASSPEDIYRLKEEGKLIILPTMENSLPIGHDLSRIQAIYDKGARIFGLVHTKNNDICDSSTDSLEYGGLSPLGDSVVRELNRLGAIIDVSHASDDTFYDVLKLSTAPIIASHSSAREIAHHPRNLNDSMLMALKENGGVIQICILDSYVKDFEKDTLYDAEISAARKAYYSLDRGDTVAVKAALAKFDEIKSRYPNQSATVKDYVDHIDHVAKLIGVDYVGIGTDFDGGGGVSDCKDVSELVNITAELLSRGYTKEEIEKIWGGNFIRVFKAAIAGREA